MYCLQSSLFIALSRIFDDAPEASTIRRLINTTIGNLELFSAPALATRNMRGDRQPDLPGAWVPASADDLRHLKRALKPHSSLYLHGLRPKLGTRSYREYNRRIRDGVSAVLERLPDGRTHHANESP
jgi:hypothetical protein